MKHEVNAGFSSLWSGLIKSQGGGQAYDGREKNRTGLNVHDNVQVHFHIHPSSIFFFSVYSVSLSTKSRAVALFRW